MENFYKITKEEAEAIGRFEYAPNKAFDPFVSEQNDGSYIASEEMYILLKEKEEFKKIDWTGKKTIEKNSLDTKSTEV